MCGCNGIDPIDNPSEEFKTQCEHCVDVYGGNKYAMGKESDATSALAKEHTAAVLCSEPSLNGKTRKGRNTQSSSVFKFRP